MTTVPLSPVDHEAPGHDRAYCATCDNRAPSWWDRSTKEVEGLLADHRRLRNTRSCSGCSWEPSPALRGHATGDPEATRARHAEFNAHLAALIVEALL